MKLYTNNINITEFQRQLNNLSCLSYRDMSVKKAREPALNAKLNLIAKAIRLVHKIINAKMTSALQWVGVHNNFFTVL